MRERDEWIRITRNEKYSISVTDFEAKGSRLYITMCRRS
jgi:hypothetical protein